MSEKTSTRKRADGKTMGKTTDPFRFVFALPVEMDVGALHLFQRFDGHLQPALGTQAGTRVIGLV